jgi:integrase
MQTLTEIDRRESARREKAHRFQVLRESLYRARRDVERLTPRVTAASETLRQVETLRSTAMLLPPDVQGILHDFRRTAVRNLERAGVPRSVAMRLVGHKTESVYRRYAIADERDLRVAVERLDASAVG